MAFLHHARWAFPATLSFLLCLLCFHSLSPAQAHAAPPDPGVSRQLATSRAALLSDLEPASQPWKHFYEDIKPLAYGIDETQGTTPWSSAQTQLTSALGKPCPSYIFANAGDQAYGRFLLDQTSESLVSSVLAPDTKPGAPGLASETWVPDPLLRTQLWGALWDNVHVALSPPSRYVDLALKSLPSETDESLARINGARIATALHTYLSFLGAWLSAFLDGQHSPEAQAAIHAWLASHTIDSDLRLKVLEASDALDRTVLIRTRFPE